MIDIRQKISQLVFVDTESPQLIAEKIISSWKANKSASIIHYMYYASYVLMHQNRDILRDYLLADYILVDGIGMQICFKIITGKKIANLNGTDMSPLFIDILHHSSVPICFYGTTKENIQSCNLKLNQQYGTQVLTYFQDGYSPLDLNKIPENCALFIGMGSPRQEQWVTEHLDWIKEKKILVFTVGGYFDFLSGFYIRAPQWVRTIKMEWAWRTILHPSRHYQKRLRDMSIIFLPFLHKLRKYKDYIFIKKL
ncbi:MAG: WecB/TagA/CpsF family glycosyltransferase [Chitinophagales bacterium]|nr:WecB/TagA/CpsF family glycosyltransferase [Chitinophagales bacterium]MCZ2393216.1 WecB/TagA/CpsF family glycosyltransferase [Chitinophagales bacterium]